MALVPIGGSFDNLVLLGAGNGRFWGGTGADRVNGGGRAGRDQWRRTGTITAFGQLSYRTTATTTIISIGFNSPSAFDVIRLDEVHVLTATDFVL